MQIGARERWLDFSSSRWSEFAPTNSENVGSQLHSLRQSASVSSPATWVTTLGRTGGATTLEAISCALNQRGVRPARGTRWHVSSVATLLSRKQKFVEAR